MISGEVHPKSWIILWRKRIKRLIGLVACERQMASPLILAGCVSCRSSPGSSPALIGTALWPQNFLLLHCPNSFLCSSCSGRSLWLWASAGIACAGIATPGRSGGSVLSHQGLAQTPA